MKLFLVGLLVVLLSTGTMNTLLSKAQDHTCVEFCDDKQKERCYEQPIWQSITMFTGEILCLFAYFVMERMHKQKLRSRGVSSSLTPSDNPSVLETLLDSHPDPLRKPMSGRDYFYMWIPACFDICGSTVMMLGLIYLRSSIFQMLRGAIVIFTALASVIFLKARLPPYKWASLLLISLGVLTVGLFQGEQVLFGACGEMRSGGEKKGMILGVMFVLVSQVFTACQFVAEEKIMSRFTLPPIKAVGLEGLFGLTTTLAILGVLHFSFSSSDAIAEHWRIMFDASQGFKDTFMTSTHLTMLSMGSILAISLFNFCGLSITRMLSSTARSTVDMCRTFFVWLSALLLGWESLAGGQLVGFAMLMYGTFMFNDVVRPPVFLRGRVPVSDSTVHPSHGDHSLTEETEKKSAFDSPSRSKADHLHMRWNADSLLVQEGDPEKEDNVHHTPRSRHTPMRAAKE